jgi:hypothetical protein
MPEPHHATRAGATRRTVLARLGAAIVGVSAATFMADKAANAAPLPRFCGGSAGCDYGCGSTPVGKCCWYATDNANCKTYQCCDRYDLSPRPCVCRYFVGNFC